MQFIFITHNKTTMELASQLIGVTMNEPGVSRLVAVDVDEAVRMAACSAVRMTELRWILLGFGIVLLAAIYLWGRRGNARSPSD